MRWISNLLFLCVHLADAVTIRVDGEGYLRFLKNGSLIYQKKADLKIVKGMLANQNGDSISPFISIPKEFENFHIDLNGFVYGQSNSNSKSIGQLVLATSKGKKKRVSKGVYQFEGSVRIGNPGENEWGVIRLIGSVPKPLNKSEKSFSALSSLSYSKRNLEFKNDVEIEKDQFTLGELVKDDLPDYLKKIVLGETPAFGAIRQLSRSQIESRMKFAGHNLRDFKCVFPSQIRIKRKSQIISHEQICEVALEAAKKQLGEVELAPGYQPTMNAPLGELNLAVESLKGYKNSWNALIGIYIDGKRFNGRNIPIIRSGIAASIQIGSIVKIVIRSNGVLVETKGKLKFLHDRAAQVEYKPNTVVEGILQHDGSIEVIL